MVAYVNPGSSFHMYIYYIHYILYNIYYIKLYYILGAVLGIEIRTFTPNPNPKLHLQPF